MSEYANLPVAPETAERIEALIDDKMTPYETRDDVVRSLLAAHDREPALVRIERYPDGDPETRYLWPGQSTEAVGQTSVVSVER